MTGQGYALLSKQPNGGWRMMDGGQGIPEFLATKGAGGWPDISIGGPGFCFPVVRWNGKEYAIHRSEEHTSELQSLMRISYAVFCLKKKITTKTSSDTQQHNNEPNAIDANTIITTE